jgi:two-component system, chemotaxis family, CheB/CheR fusion protein
LSWVNIHKILPFSQDAVMPQTSDVNRNRSASSNVQEARCDDIANVLASMDIALLLLGRDMCLKLFNPAACELLNLRQEDIGLCISTFSGKIDTEQLLMDAAEVLENRHTGKQEIIVKTNNRTFCYLQHIVPCHTLTGSIDGVVITFVDITDRQQMKMQLENALHVREQRLAAIMSYMAEAIIVIGNDGVMNECNPAAEKMFGYGADEMKGQNIKMLMPPSYYGKYDRRIESNRKPIPSTIVNERREFFGRRKEGSIFPMELTITEIDHLGLFIGIYRDISKQRQLEKEIANISTREQESIGRELHDTLGQQLTGLNMLATSLKQGLVEKNEPESRLLGEIIEQLKEAAETVRRISHGLAPISIPPDGLQDALAHLAATVRSNGNVQCDFDGDHSIKLQDQDVANQLYRIAQEAFNNALKHAQAKSIRLRLQSLGSHVELIVSDDGQGCDPDEKSHDGGVGLHVMQYRAKMIGARISVTSVPGKGTEVRCRLPISGKP